MALPEPLGLLAPLADVHAAPENHRVERSEVSDLLDRSDLGLVPRVPQFLADGLRDLRRGAVHRAVRDQDTHSFSPRSLEDGGAALGVFVHTVVTPHTSRNRREGPCWGRPQLSAPTACSTAARTSPERATFVRLVM